MKLNVNITMQKLTATIKNGNRIYCYGAGLIGKEFCEKMSKEDVDFTKIILVDSNPQKTNTIINISNTSFKIVDKNFLINNVNENDYLVITVGVEFFRDVFKELNACEQLKKIQVGISRFIYLEQIKTNTEYCPICDKDVLLVEVDSSQREGYLCTECLSTPRQRLLINTLNAYISGWEKLIIHESSPGGASSQYIRERAACYNSSQYFPNHDSGEMVTYKNEEILCQNIEEMSFENNAFDLFITQDVFEHILNPDDAFKDICRVLKKDGKHIFTVPRDINLEKSMHRAKEGLRGDIILTQEPIYHKNPVDKDGSLVTFDYGKDLEDLICKASNMKTQVYINKAENRQLGNLPTEVFISNK